MAALEWKGEEEEAKAWAEETKGREWDGGDRPTNWAPSPALSNRPAWHSRRMESDAVPANERRRWTNDVAALPRHCHGGHGPRRPFHARHFSPTLRAGLSHPPHWWGWGSCDVWSPPSPSAASFSSAHEYDASRTWGLDWCLFGFSSLAWEAKDATMGQMRHWRERGSEGYTRKKRRSHARRARAMWYKRRSVRVGWRRREPLAA